MTEKKMQKQIEAQKAVIDALQETISAQERTILAKTNLSHALMDLKVMMATKESADLPHVPETDFGKTILLRPEVRWFAEEMERKLRKNDHKDGWDTCKIDWLLKRVGDEVGELRRAVQARGGLAIIDEAADVANFCMMLADRVRE